MMPAHSWKANRSALTCKARIVGSGSRTIRPVNVKALRGVWTKNSLKPGDEVVTETHPAKNGVTTGLSGTANALLKFVVNGKPLSFY